MHSERSNSRLPDPGIDSDDTAIVCLSAPPPPCRVLIVDDDPETVATISTLLESGGYDIHTAISGDVALRVLDAKDCQIVITDWQMPGMDGIAFCMNLRQRKSDGYVYVIVLSALDGKENILAGLAAGADDYVVKGTSAEEILARVDVGKRIAHLDRSLRASRQENERISTTDPLTGVCNRRFLMKYLPRELMRSQRYNHPLAVIACDVDDFADIVERFGHAAGDEVLQSFVRRAGKCVRQGIDWLARFTAGEFIFVLPETNAAGAICVARRLREMFSAHPVSTSAGLIEITASMGVTALETAQELKSASSVELLRAADRELYTSRKVAKFRPSGET